MTSHKSLKYSITEAVLREIPSAHKKYYDAPIEKLLFKLWFTGRQEGLRLTDAGKALFELADIEFYDHNFKQDGKSYYSFISELNKKIKCPYYIGVNKNGKETNFYIRLYDSKIAIMLNLFGNLQEYLDSIKVKK